ncbi:MAG: class I SAM-dependent DNA methyltransferase, partial [ANME-2 cluster archaeon]
MDKQRAEKLLDETFNCEFNTDRFSRFIKELFNEFIITHRERHAWSEFKSHIDTYQFLGSYTDKSNRPYKSIDVLDVKLKSTSSIDRARTKQRNFVAKYLGAANKNAALVAFYGDDPEDWRFSFVKLDYHLEHEPGKVKPVEDLTPAKRYSYLVGVNEPNHTCRTQFLDLIIDEDTNPSLDKIENAFSIEKVTKEFFDKYRDLFFKLRDALDNAIKKYPNVKEEFEEKNIKTDDFAKKLLGQIVFLYFLQKKGWLGVEKDNNTGKFKEWGTGHKKFLTKLINGDIVDYENITGDNDKFFNDILEPLFYSALSTPRENDYYEIFDYKCKIPFLNGGLFEPLNYYNWQEIDILLDNQIFQDIIKTFDEFNFTVKEDEPLDKEVAVDPEMLGKVFENLLDVNDRKSKGAFYTPREIVHYMCQQSLINYLETNTDVPLGDIETFIQHGELAQQITSKSDVEEKYLPASIKKNYSKIDNLLKNIKIVDPAVGSGAFPMGMMNEIVKARSILSWLSLDDKPNYYDLKRETIENCLYGVDIDSSAVDITKLRFWLSLVVDESDIKKIKPLPNLDHKIMCGNSLLEEFEGVKLFDERLLE